MKKTHLLVLAGAFLAAGAAGAQGTPEHGKGEMKGHGKGHEMRGHKMKGEMKGPELDQATRERIKAVHAKYRPQRAALHETMRRNMMAMQEARKSGNEAAIQQAKAALEQGRAQSKALHEAQQAEILAAVPAADRPKFEEHMRHMNEMRTEMRKERQGERKMWKKGEGRKDKAHGNEHGAKK